jgi:hypothetical protein
MAKKIAIGKLLVSKFPDGSPSVSLALGNNSTNPKYKLSVEITVKDGNGNTVAKQTDGFLNLNDPRTAPDELLSKGIISEDTAIEMKDRLAKLSDKVKYEILMAKK